MSVSGARPEIVCCHNMTVRAEKNAGRMRDQDRIAKMKGVAHYAKRRYLRFIDESDGNIEA